MKRTFWPALLLWSATCDGQQSSSCFVAGTRIATPRGEVPIEEVVVGQTVYAFDERNRKLVERSVLTVFHHAAARAGILALDAGRELKLTREHPVYRLRDARYVPAAELTENDEVLVLADEQTGGELLQNGGTLQPLRVAAPLALKSDDEPVFNLHIEGEQNYFADGVLVHNKSPTLLCETPTDALVANVRTEPPGQGEIVVGSAGYSCPSPCTSLVIDTRTQRCPPSAKISDLWMQARLWPDAFPSVHVAGWTGCKSSYGATCLVTAAPLLNGTPERAYEVTARFAPCMAGLGCPLYLGGIWDDRSWDLWGLWVGSDGVPWVVSNSFGSGSVPRIYKWDGHSLVEKSGMSPMGITGDLRAIWGTPSGEHFTGGQAGLLLRDAQRFTVPNTGDIYSMWGSDAKNIWAVGSYGTIVKWDGTQWQRQQAMGVIQNLYGVWGSSATDVWIVGEKGRVLHHDGATWSLRDAGVTSDLWSVFALASDQAYAVGAGGVVLSWDGTTWSPQNSGTTATLYRVHGSSRTNLWAVGARGTSLRSGDGTNWATVPSNTTVDLHNVWATAGGTTYAVGQTVFVLWR